jgi:ribosomal protein S18 acetylase RimI-like enzyme
MKIAYHNVKPTQQTFQQFVHMAGDAADSSKGMQYETVCRSKYVIAAYDEEELVGLGTIIEANEREAIMDVAVHKSYRQRGIEQYIMKLLKAEFLYH